MGHAHAALRPIGPCVLSVQMSVFIIAHGGPQFQDGRFNLVCSAAFSPREALAQCPVDIIEHHLVSIGKTFLPIWQRDTIMLVLCERVSLMQRATLFDRMLEQKLRQAAFEADPSSALVSAELCILWIASFAHISELRASEQGPTYLLIRIHIESHQLCTLISLSCLPSFSIRIAF